MKNNAETNQSGPIRRYVVCLPTAKVGDFLLTTPLLSAIRAHSPDAYICLLLRKPDPGEWVTKHPLVDDVIWCNPNDKTKRRDLWRVTRELREHRFDVGIYRGVSGHFAWMMWLARIPVRIAGPYLHMRFLLTHPTGEDRELAERHEVTYNLDMLAPLGIPRLEGRVCLPVTQEERDDAARLLQSHGVGADVPLIALNTGHGGSARAWPPQRFAQATRRLADEIGARILIIGQNSPNDTQNEIAPKDQAGFIDLTGQTTIGLLAALLERCRLHIGVDTGTGHVAAAMGTPCVTLFPDHQGWKLRARWRPWQTPQRLLGPSARCAGCVKKCYRNGAECRLSITVEQVVAAARDLLADVPSAAVLSDVSSTDAPDVCAVTEAGTHFATSRHENAL